MACAALAALLLSVTGCSRLGLPGSDSGGTSVSSPPVAGAPAHGGYAPSDSASQEKGVGLSFGGAQDARSAAAAPAAVSADRMVIRNANMRLEVTKVAASVKSIRALTTRFGGLVSNLQLSTDDGGSPQPVPQAEGSRTLQSGLPFSGSITVRIPVGKFDAFHNEAEKLGRILSETSDDQDVTQQHVDLKARLANAKAEEARLRTFFDKARSVNDMLAVERELGRVRGEIESMTAQLTTLERQAAMATLTIELVEPQPIVRPSNGIDWGFGDALTTGIQGMVDLLKGIIVVAIALAPLWVLAIVAFFLIRWAVRVRRARRVSAPAVDEEAQE
jgi:hypothetical protein